MNAGKFISNISRFLTMMKSDLHLYFLGISLLFPYFSAVIFTYTKNTHCSAGIAILFLVPIRISRQI
jgi:hypothetical protein